MKKLILLIIILTSFYSCYKDNGEPLRKNNGDISSEDYSYEEVPCGNDININSITHTQGSTYFWNVETSLSGNYINNGFQIKGSRPSSNYEYFIEFYSKPSTKRKYTNAKPSNFNTINNCILYARFKSTQEDFFAGNGNVIYVDTIPDNHLFVSFCLTNNISNRWFNSLENRYLTIINGNFKTY